MESNSYEVEEGVAVSVCISLSSDIERSVEVTLITSSGSLADSASGKTLIGSECMHFTQCLKYTETADYTPVVRIFTFQSNDAFCENVTTIEDEVLETAEIFEISVSSSDPNVSMGAFPTASITILDEDGR